MSDSFLWSNNSINKLYFVLTEQNTFDSISPTKKDLSSLISLFKWWAWRESNSHGGNPLDPKSSASTNFATRPCFIKFSILLRIEALFFDMQRLPTSHKTILNRFVRQSATRPCLIFKSLRKKGRGGIRTHGTLVTYDGFQDRSFKPLRHSSEQSVIK